jgi:alpha-tubulin suppressor-like RCC1 family protein
MGFRAGASVGFALSAFALFVDACGARSPLGLGAADASSGSDASTGGTGATGGSGGNGGSGGSGGSASGGKGGVDAGGKGGADAGGKGGVDAGGSGGVPGLVPIEIATRDEHTCVLFNSGAVKCWGVNRRGGILGYGHTQDHISDPRQVGFVSLNPTPGAIVNHLFVGSGVTCVLFSNRSLKCWGEGQYGQLGYGNTQNIGDDELPSSVGSIRITMTPGVTVQSAGGALIHTCALLSDGSVKCWGSGCCNGYGTGIGDNEVPASVGPLNIGTPPGIRIQALALNGIYSCVMLSNGDVKCWGNNNFGQLGSGNTVSVSNPSNAGTISVTSSPAVRVRQLAAGFQHVCALLSDTSVKCWGYNANGQLGYGHTTHIGDNELPSSVGSVSITTPAGSQVRALAAGAHHSCALLDNGSIKCWGLNTYGQLGYGHTRNIGDNEVPSSVGAVSVTAAPGVWVEQLALGDYHTCALLSDRSIKCWGENSLGQLGYGHTRRIGDDELPSSVGSVVLF